MTGRMNQDQLGKVRRAFECDPRATVRELSERTGIAMSSVYQYLVRLEKDGLIHGRDTRNWNRNGRWTLRNMTAEELTAKRRAAARRVLQNRTRRMNDLERRIERVVEKAKAVEVDRDVIRIDRKRLFDGRIHAVKVG